MMVHHKACQKIASLFPRSQQIASLLSMVTAKVQNFTDNSNNLQYPGNQPGGILLHRVTNLLVGVMMVILVIKLILD